MGKQHASSPRLSGSSPAGDAVTAGAGAAVLRATLHMYRTAVSPLLPRSCRFHPSCSQFAMEAVALHGAVEGGRLTLRRLARCHPWNPGGFDPVPPRKV